MAVSLPCLFPMSFATRLLQLRKAKGYTQQSLSEAVGLHITQIKRYELGQSEPNLEAIRKIAHALNTSADALVFDEGERGPSDDLRLQFDAVARMSEEERLVVRDLLEGMILKHEARRWSRVAER
ncbi:MAG: helix-turn-helix transcriptional regulator [Pseudomonadota bacterium]|nr:helix-turn-helix transcriptional regulator [Pseudomonadota bacterium]